MKSIIGIRSLLAVAVACTGFGYAPSPSHAIGVASLASGAYTLALDDQGSGRYGGFSSNAECQHGSGQCE